MPFAGIGSLLGGFADSMQKNRQMELEQQQFKDSKALQIYGMLTDPNNTLSQGLAPGEKNQILAAMTDHLLGMARPGQFKPDTSNPAMKLVNQMAEKLSSGFKGTPKQVQPAQQSGVGTGNAKTPLGGITPQGGAPAMPPAPDASTQPQIAAPMPAPPTDFGSADSSATGDMPLPPTTPIAAQATPQADANPTMPATLENDPWEDKLQDAADKETASGATYAPNTELLTKYRAAKMQDILDAHKALLTATGGTGDPVAWAKTQAQAKNASDQIEMAGRSASWQDRVANDPELQRLKTENPTRYDMMYQGHMQPGQSATMPLGAIQPKEISDTLNPQEADAMAAQLGVQGFDSSKSPAWKLFKSPVPGRSTFMPVTPDAEQKPMLVTGIDGKQKLQGVWYDKKGQPLTNLPRTDLPPTFGMGNTQTFPEIKEVQNNDGTTSLVPVSVTSTRTGAGMTMPGGAGASIGAPVAVPGSGSPAKAAERAKMDTQVNSTRNTIGNLNGLYDAMGSSSLTSRVKEYLSADPHSATATALASQLSPAEARVAGQVMNASRSVMQTRGALDDTGRLNAKILDAIQSGGGNLLANPGTSKTSIEFTLHTLAQIHKDAIAARDGDPITAVPASKMSHEVKDSYLRIAHGDVKQAGALAAADGWKF